MEIIEATLESGSDDVDPLNDEAVTLALEQGGASIDGKVKEARSRSIAEQISAMSKEDHHAVVEALKKVLGERQMGSADLEVSLFDSTLVARSLTKHSRRPFPVFFPHRVLCRFVSK